MGCEGRDAGRGVPGVAVLEKLHGSEDHGWDA